MKNKKVSPEIFSWYENIINSLKNIFLENYENDDTLKMQFLATEIEKSLDIIANENFLSYLNKKIEESAKNKKLNKNIKNDLLFYQALSLILSHLLNKQIIERKITDIDTLETIEKYKIRVSELLMLRDNDNQEINKLRTDSEYYWRKLEDLLEILIKNWIDWKNIKLNELVRKFFDFWKITKILNIRFPDEEITDDCLVDKVEKLSKWYETMKILLNFLIKKWVLIKTSSWWYKINSTVTTALDWEIYIKWNNSKGHVTAIENRRAELIKAENLWNHTIESFILNDINQESDLDKARKEIDELKEKLIKSEKWIIDEESKYKKSQFELEKISKENQELQNIINWLRLELTKKWFTAQQIKKIIESYEENQ